MSNAKRDDNREPTKLAVDSNGVAKNLLVCPVTGRLLIDIAVVTDPGATTLNRDTVDENREHMAQGVTDDANKTPTPWHIDNRNGLLFLDINVE